MLIGVYQKTFSLDTGFLGVVVKLFFSSIFGERICRFYPCCSDYAGLAISQYGLSKGTMLSLKRILRCGPWSRGGYDPV